jgi:hypothetical protein
MAKRGGTKRPCTEHLPSSSLQLQNSPQRAPEFDWIKNLRSLNTQELLDEFFLLFATVSEVSLSEGRDPIIWCWTRSGEYSTASAYEAQFLGANSAFKASSIW